MKDRHILITGSSSGLGRAAAEKLLGAGATVYGIARNHRKFRPNSSSYYPITLDVSDLKNLSEKVSKLIKENPEINGLISNAGYGEFNGFENFSTEKIISYVNDNLVSHLIVTRYLLPHFKTRNSGDIIFIGSESALVGGGKGSLYSATKFGLRGFAQSIRQESSDKNIRVTLINPGMVKTSFFDNLNFRPGKNEENAIDPDDVADMILNVLSMRLGTVVDEINLTPLKKVIQFN